MKKILAFALTLTLAFGMIACGGSTATTTAAPAGETTAAAAETTAAAAEETTAAAAETTAAAAEETTAAAAPAANVAKIDWTGYDQLIADIKAETDTTKREALMHEAEDMLMDTGALVPIYYYNDIYMAKPTVTGYYANQYGFKFFHKATVEGSDTLRLQLASEPDRLDPALNSSVDGAALALAGFAGLFTYDETGAVVPELAESYTVSEDGKTYTIVLKDGLKWSDGSELTAKDFEYAWKRAANPETAADYSYMFDQFEGYGEEGKDINVTASEDGKTLTAVLKNPVAYFLDLLAFPTYLPVKQDVVEGAEGFKDADGNVVNPGAWALEAGFVSNGPFMLESWEHNTSMVYVKNPNYYNADAVTLERLEFMLSADDAAVYAAYQAGDLDFIDTIPADEIGGLLDTPEFHIVEQLGTYYAIFNVNDAIFADKTVEQAKALRKALSALIDRQYIVDTVAQTGQKVATSFIPAGMLDGHGGVFKSNDADYTFPVDDGYFTVEPNVDDALALLEEAGYTLDGDKLSAETPLHIVYITNPGTGHEGIAQVMQQDFSQVGITMEIKTAEWNVFLNERKAGNFSMARNGWIADFNDPINMLEMWTSDSGNNDAQFGK